MCEATVIDAQSNAMLKTLLQAVLEESGKQFSTSSVVRRGIRMLYSATLSGTHDDRKGKLSRLSSDLALLAKGAL